MIIKLFIYIYVFMENLNAQKSTECVYMRKGRKYSKYNMHYDIRRIKLYLNSISLRSRFINSFNNFIKILFSF